MQLGGMAARSTFLKSGRGAELLALARFIAVLTSAQFLSGCQVNLAEAIMGVSAEDVISTDQTVQGTSLSGAGGVSVAAGLTDPTGSLAISGSSVTSTNGNVAFSAAKDITIASVGEEHDSTTTTVRVSTGFLSSSKTTTLDTVNINSQVASTISGNVVNTQSGGDTNVVVSNVAATSGLNLAAANSRRAGP